MSSRQFLSVSFFVICSSVFAAAQTPEAPTTQALKVTAPPKLDGRLDDPIWQKAAVISGFKQREPEEGRDASEPTTVRIAYDQSHLYIGAVLTEAFYPRRGVTPEIHALSTLLVAGTMAAILIVAWLQARRDHTTKE